MPHNIALKPSCHLLIKINMCSWAYSEVHEQLRGNNIMYLTELFEETDVLLKSIK